MRVLASTGCVTHYPTRVDHRLVADVRALPVDGYELSIYPGWIEGGEGVAADLAELALPVVTAHAEKPIGARLSEGDAGAVDRLEANAHLAAGLGARLLVLHLWELPVGDRHLERNLELLPACIDAVEAHGLRLGIETIPCSVGSPLVNAARAVERDPRCLVVLDTEFLALHGQLERAPDAGLPVGHVHLKDFAGELRPGDPRTRYLLPGEGSLDLDGFLSRLRDGGYDGAVTLEASAVAPDGGLDRTRLAEIAEALTRLDSAHGT